MSTGAVALFVKTPGLSPVKTRLASSLSNQMAEAFHWAAARAVAASIKVVSQQTPVQGYYAVAEEGALHHNAWQDMPRLWQGNGGLGERMREVYQTLLAQHDFVMLVGADIPQMTPQQLINAATWLANAQQTRFSFGPSVDGGFWLFGGNAPLPDPLWTEVTYSTTDTGAKFLSNIEPLGKVRCIEVLHDADEACDLIILYETLRNMPDLLPEQRDLLHFLATLSHSFFLPC